ncbi:MAG: hypothetical protein ACK6CT_15260, partial [Planctomycetia bacterium]
TGRNFKKKDALVEHVEDCRRMGIEVAPPDVNASIADFSVAGGRILFGLAARSVTVKITEGVHDEATLDRLAEIVRRHPGRVPLRMVIEMADGSRVLMEADRDRVAWSGELRMAIVELLGPGALRAAIDLGGRREQEPARRGGGRPAGVA